MMMRIFDNPNTKLFYDEYEKLRNDLAAPILKDIEETNAKIKLLFSACIDAYQFHVARGIVGGQGKVEIYIGQLIGEAQAYGEFLKNNSTSGLDKEYKILLAEDLKRINSFEKKGYRIMAMDHDNLASLIANMSSRIQHFNSLLVREVTLRSCDEAREKLKSLNQLIGDLNIKKPEIEDRKLEIVDQQPLVQMRPKQ